MSSTDYVGFGKLPSENRKWYCDINSVLTAAPYTVPGQGRAAAPYTVLTDGAKRHKLQQMIINNNNNNLFLDLFISATIYCHTTWQRTVF